MEGFDYKSYREQFISLREELKRISEKSNDFNKELEKIRIIEDIASKYEDGSLLKREIEDWLDSWLKGDRIFDLEEYITRKELENIIQEDCYYLHDDFVHGSFIDGDTISTILTPEALVDRWFFKGLPYLVACPWSPPPRQDYSYQHDCEDVKTRCIKVYRLRRFLDEHQLPVPAEIFPNDATNTFYTLGRIEHSAKKLAEMRTREREALELEELRRNEERSTPPGTSPVLNNYSVTNVVVAGIVSEVPTSRDQAPPADQDVNKAQAEVQFAPVAKVKVEEPADVAVKNTKPFSGRGRKSKFSDTECVKIYRQHYQENNSITTIAKEYAWMNSPFADNPVFETAKSRINEALKRGRKLTPVRDRPAKDKTGRK